MKWKDEIVEEVRAVREVYAAQFDYDLKRIFEDLRRATPLRRLRNSERTLDDLSTGEGPTFELLLEERLDLGLQFHPHRLTIRQGREARKSEGVLLPPFATLRSDCPLA